MRRNIIAITVAAAALAAPAFSGEAPKKKEQDRRSMIEMHEQMSKLHAQAAKCLKKGRPAKECRNEAMKNCPMMKGKADPKMCPFMDGMMMKDMPMHEHPQGGREHPKGSDEK